MAKEKAAKKDDVQATVQRPPAEVLHAEELAYLRETDRGPRPPGWQLSLRAVRRFLLGDPPTSKEKVTIRRKVVFPPSLIDRCMVTLATSRGLMLVGEPGTAKSLVSELLTAAISGRSTLTIQGGASVTEDQIKYSWNYALLVNEGPSLRSLVPAPLFLGMRDGAIVRFEEITRCPLEVQDSMLSVLSDRVLAVPELDGPDGMLFAREGFNVIATANTRDKGVNEMSAALKRRFNFETVFPILDHQAELRLVREETTRLLEKSGVPLAPSEDVLDLLVTTFRELRSGTSDDGSGMERLSAVMSTAEAVSVAHAVGVRGFYLRGDAGTPADLVEHLAGTAAKDDAEDLRKLRRYLEQRASKKKGEHWQAYHAARGLLGGG
ncbi:MAG: AAA family ATPase [Myxococcales bacterium]|nr:AAA family ATPase [Myxococcales bacterium]